MMCIFEHQMKLSSPTNNNTTTEAYNMEPQVQAKASEMEVGVNNGSTQTRHPRSSRRGSTSSAKKSTRTYVKHDYEDHYFDPIVDPMEVEKEKHEGGRRGPRGGVVQPFPERLYTMLKDAEPNDFDDVVSWQPHGRCFIVHDAKAFVDNIMPKYFRQSKLTSFQRQVNLYGFRRLTAGPDRGAYYHKLFLRGRPDLHSRMVRMRVKGTGCKSAASPATEPNFYAFEPCKEDDPRNQATGGEAALPPPPPLEASSVPEVAASSKPAVVEQEPFRLCFPDAKPFVEDRQEQFQQLSFPVTAVSDGNSDGISMDTDAHRLAEENTDPPAMCNNHFKDMGTSLNYALSSLQMQALTRRNNTNSMPRLQARNAQQHSHASTSSAQGGNSTTNEVDFRRPLAAPRTLPSFNDFQSFGSRREESSSGLYAPNSSGGAYFSSDGQQHTPNERQGFASTGADQMQFGSSEMNDSFQDQVSRLLQDPIQQDHHFDGLVDWFYDPLMVQSEVL